MPHFYITSTFTILLYLGAALLQLQYVLRPRFNVRFWVIWLSICALTLHGFLLYRWTEIHGGQNLDLCNIASMVAWLIGLIVVFTASYRPTENLLIFIFPLSACSIALVNQFSGLYVVYTAHHLGPLMHILLSILAFSVLGVAALQAVLLICQLWRLQRYPGRIFRVLPPIETMEMLLVQFIRVGFVLLTVGIVTGFVIDSSYPTMTLIGKLSLSLLAWVIFGGLLVGRGLFGWQVKAAAYWAVVGMLILIVAYFGIRIV
jgi:ABC-type uncharacterized transport system permease subunit